jgi:hypothetical protein
MSEQTGGGGLSGREGVIQAVLEDFSGEHESNRKHELMFSVAVSL